MPATFKKPTKPFSLKKPTQPFELKPPTQPFATQPTPVQQLSGLQTLVPTQPIPPQPATITPEPISIESLTTTEAPIVPVQPQVETVPDISTLQPAPPPTEFTTPSGIKVDASGNLLEEVKPTPEREQLSPTEQRLSTLIQETTGLTGVAAEEEARRAELEAAPEIEKQRQTVQGLSGQLTQLQAEAQQIPLQLQQEAIGRGITIGGLMPLQTARLRTNAIASLGISAQLEASRGNLELALNLIDRKVDAEFAPRKSELETALQNIELLKADPRLTIAEEERADKRTLRLQKELDSLEEARADRKKAGDILAEAASLGADSELQKRISESETSAEALRIASEGGFVDESAQLERSLLEEQIKSQITSRAINIAKFDIQRAKDKEEENAIVEAREEAIEANFRKIPAINDKIIRLESIFKPATDTEPSFTHRGLNSAVGATPFGRIATIDVLGAKDDFIGSVQQLVSQETIDTLVNLKARGGTLGALSDQERIMLQNAATKIGGWAMTDPDTLKVTGYDIDESSFKEEIAVLLNLTVRAKNAALGDTLSDEDSSEIDSL